MFLLHCGVRHKISKYVMLSKLLNHGWRDSTQEKTKIVA